MYQYLERSLLYRISNAQGAPYQAFCGVGRCVIKRLDPQVAFDPLKKQFDLPALFVNFGNGGR